MKLKVKASERKYFKGEGTVGHCSYTIQAQKIGEELVYALVTLGVMTKEKDLVELRFNQKYGSKELTPEISFGSSSDKSLERALAVYHAIREAIQIVNNGGPSWIEQNIQPD